jgi:hypothetical protein
MKANKVTLNITVEVLSIDSVPALLIELARSIEAENIRGRLGKSDGDTVSWNYHEREVKI